MASDTITDRIEQGGGPRRTPRDHGPTCTRESAKIADPLAMQRCTASAKIPLRRGPGPDSQSKPITGIVDQPLTPAPTDDRTAQPEARDHRDRKSRAERSRDDRHRRTHPTPPAPRPRRPSRPRATRPPDHHPITQTRSTGPPLQPLHRAPAVHNRRAPQPPLADQLVQKGHAVINTERPSTGTGKAQPGRRRLRSPPRSNPPGRQLRSQPTRHRNPNQRTRLPDGSRPRRPGWAPAPPERRAKARDRPAERPDQSHLSNEESQSPRGLQAPEPLQPASKQRRSRIAKRIETPPPDPRPTREDQSRSTNGPSPSEPARSRSTGCGKISATNRSAICRACSLPKPSTAACAITAIWS